MKIKKRILSACLSAVMCCSTLPLLSASAYDVCDVNHDGSVDYTDSLILGRYLSGTISAPNYKRFDVTRDGVVNEFDSKYLTDKLMSGTGSYCYVRRTYNNGVPSEVNVPFYYDDGLDTPAQPNVDNEVYTSRLYKYATYQNNVYQTGSNSHYRITPTQTTVSMNGGGAQTLSDDDPRPYAYGTSYGEITGVVNVNGGTGFIVGDHEIATCGHMVLTKAYEGGPTVFRSTISVKTCNSLGQISSTPLNVEQVHVSQSYFNAHSVLEDYALIVVTEDLSDYVHFQIGLSYGATNGTGNNEPHDWAGVPIHVTGQPTSTQNGQLFKTDCGEVHGTNNTSIFYYSTLSAGGTSGSPVYTITKYTPPGSNATPQYYYTALAVHSTNYTSFRGGPVFTKYHRQFFLNNPRDPYV